MGERRLILILCTAEVLTMVGVYAVPALLPGFIGAWGLSKAEAGWTAGITFLSYALAAPPLLALTDRIDAKLICCAGAGLAAAASAGFALIASGLVSALMFRALAGAGLAATYMPGMRALIDRYGRPTPSRAVATYTACFSLGTAVSYFLAGWLAGAFGWRTAFAVAAVAALIAMALYAGLPRHRPPAPDAPARLFDPRPVVANTAALGFILAYGAHCWELFTWRSWMVAFLVFALALDGGGGWPAATDVAGASGLIAMAASFGGNELCLRYGRRRVIACVMAASALAAASIGFAAPLGYLVLAVLALGYTALIQLDSAALTAGAVAAARPGQQGATLAMHALIGFGCAGIGPLVLGVVLDATGGGATSLSWGLAFASMAVIGLLGPLALRMCR